MRSWVGAREDGGRDDLAEHEHARDRQDDGHALGHELVEENGQRLVGAGVHDEQRDEQQVVALQHGAHLARALLLQLRALHLEDAHVEHVERHEAHGQAGHQARRAHEQQADAEVGPERRGVT